MIWKVKVKYLNCDFDQMINNFIQIYPFHYSKSLLDYLRVIY